MNSIPWILIGVIVLGILMVVVVRRRKEPRRVDYRNYFVMGVIWLAFAPFLILLPWLLHGEEPLFMGLFFLIMGLGYTIVGLMNRDKWGKQLEAPPETRKKTMTILGLAALVGVLAALLFATRFLFLR